MLFLSLFLYHNKSIAWLPLLVLCFLPPKPVILAVVNRSSPEAALGFKLLTPNLDGKLSSGGQLIFQYVSSSYRNHI